jgi:hypothetical protein
MSEFMELLHRDTPNIRDNENKIFNTIFEQELIKLFEKFNYTYDKLVTIFQAKLYTNLLRSDLNYIIRLISKQYNIQIQWICVYLEQFCSFKDMAEFFDEETIWALKSELSVNNNIQINKNTLSEIIN